MDGYPVEVPAFEWNLYVFEHSTYIPFEGLDISWYIFPHSDLFTSQNLIMLCIYVVMCNFDLVLACEVFVLNTFVLIISVTCVSSKSSYRCGCLFDQLKDYYWKAQPGCSGFSRMNQNYNLAGIFFYFRINFTLEMHMIFLINSTLEIEGLSDLESAGQRGQKGRPSACCTKMNI